ncbi:GDSL esterase/lipase At5g45920-like [Coffea eugenioides]|uniref:GDSL esterase/lipase At5g45920-like n=1 Tax=Coffea eugenioides TaxID=49369 RepID=UPI000F60E31E|nr:GDSL esterase/lipase At5g45920-like [Coffea eugenioides]
MRPKIYLFGDSITESSFAGGGWGASLTNHFSRRVDMVVRGFGGYNTRWALKVIDKVFPPAPAADSGVGEAEAPLAVTVFFGANDASLPDRHAAFQHVPVDEYKQNLCSIVSLLKRRWPRTHVLLITPPPIHEAARLLYPYGENKLGLPERTNEAAGSYAKACLSVAAEFQAPAIDLWTKMQQFPGWQTALLWDGLHLTERGNRIVFEEVVEKLKGEGLSLETLLADLPLITDIDPNDPLKAFEI